jgi:hypothetical protein
VEVRFCSQANAKVQLSVSFKQVLLLLRNYDSGGLATLDPVEKIVIGKIWATNFQLVSEIFKETAAPISAVIGSSH